jgi:hypothetical protein
MWVALSLSLIFLCGVGTLYADSPIDPSIDSLPGASTTPNSTASPSSATNTTSSSSGNGLGAQAQQNTTTAMKTFQNVTYKKLSQNEDDQDYDNTATPTSFNFDATNTDDE